MQSDGLVACLWCGQSAQVTITSEVSGYLAHWPTCLDHIEVAARRVRASYAADPRPRTRVVIDAVES